MDSPPSVPEGGLMRPPPRPRPRPRRACDECRKRKRKCDGDLPCSTCVRYSYTCRYGYSKSHPGARAMRPTEHSTPTPQQTPTDGPVATEDNKHEASFLEREKARFLSHASSVSQARSLGLGLGLPEPPRLHSFGYHTGIRKEPESTLSIRLPQVIPWDKARTCIDVFTATVHPIAGFMNMDYLYQRAQDYWQEGADRYPFEAVIGGVIALGSLFSSTMGEETELQVVLHTKAVLEDPVISRRPSQDLVMAWILRTIYSRATGRPNVAWLQSANTLHLIELIGLHCDRPEDTASSPHDNHDIRARITSFAQSLHIMIAYDYGKSIVHVDPGIYQHIRPRPGDCTPQLSELTSKVLTATTPTDPTSKQAQLLQAMEQLMTVAVDHDFLLLARAELCFAIHRRLHMLGLGVTRQQTKLIVAAGTAALPAARRLAAQHHPWWNVTNALFQFICVCISIDTMEAIANIQPTVETFESVVQQFNTHLVQEAFSTVLLLIDACRGEKENQASLLRRAQDTQSGNGTIPHEQGDWSIIDPQIASLFELYHEPANVGMNTIFDI